MSPEGMNRTFDDLLEEEMQYQLQKKEEKIQRGREEAARAQELILKRIEQAKSYEQQLEVCDQYIH